jgi:hypothetical protein
MNTATRPAAADLTSRMLRRATTETVNGERVLCVQYGDGASLRGTGLVRKVRDTLTFGDFYALTAAGQTARLAAIEAAPAIRNPPRYEAEPMTVGERGVW